MGKKITIQDIADALGLSRNTVSKALNNTGVLADDTRQKILRKAEEMGYRRFVYLPQEAPGENPVIKELALVTQNMPYGSHFGTYALNTFQEKISKNNCRLSMYPVRDTEIASLKLPIGFDPEKTAGILCLELFDSNYIEMLDALGLPLLFIDTASDVDLTRTNADFLLMENALSIYRLTDSLIQKGCTPPYLCRRSQPLPFLSGTLPGIPGSAPCQWPVPMQYPVYRENSLFRLYFSGGSRQPNDPASRGFRLRQRFRRHRPDPRPEETWI